MKKFLLPIACLFFGSASAQTDSIPKTPFLEVFTSSTCGPCRPGNIRIKELFIDDEDYVNRYVMVKYQMSWPGSGDPYYTTEAGGRRSFYGINSVPAMFINGVAIGNPSNMNTSVYDSEVQKYTGLKITPKLTWSNGGKTLDYNIDLEALRDVPGPANRFWISILERTTVNNVKSNGETSFEYVMKKMIPSAGEFIVGDLPKDTVVNRTGTYTFNGNYRLPSNSSDEIDHAIEHSVENFENLEVVVFVQNIDRSMVNSAWGFDPADETDTYHPMNPNNPLGENYNPDLTGSEDLEELPARLLIPNPANNQVRLSGMEGVELTLINVLGQKIESGVGAIDLSEVNNGLYIVQWTSEGESYSERLIVRH